MNVHTSQDNSAELCLQIYVAKHAKEKKGEWVSGNLVFFRMHSISDIYFVGGFGTVQWVDVADYMATKPDSIVATDPLETISVSHTCMNILSQVELLARRMRLDSLIATTPETQHVASV